MGSEGRKDRKTAKMKKREKTKKSRKKKKPSGEGKSLTLVDYSNTTFVVNEKEKEIVLRKGTA